MDENKVFSVKMEGDTLQVLLDTNKDGQPVAKLEVYGAEGLEEILNGVAKIWQKDK